MSLQKETITLAPKAVLLRAKELSSVGYFEKALEFLNENKIEVDVYEERIEMKMTSLEYRAPTRTFKGNDPRELRRKQLERRK